MATTVDAPRFQSPESVLNMLRGEGLRISTVRRLVVSSLFAAGEPVSAEELAGGGAAPLDLASVYRNLDTLEKAGVVQRLQAGEGPARYALAGSDEREYLACGRCGELREADPAQLDPAREEIRRRFGFEADFTAVPVSGVCGRCLSGH